MNQNDTLFAILAEVESHDKPLVMTDLTFGKLVDDILMPYDSNDFLFIDGVKLRRDSLKKIKIIIQKPSFTTSFADLNFALERGDPKIRQLYGEQYHVRIEALLRTCGEDVTSQAVKAYDKGIKTKISEYLPNKKDIIESGWKIFFENLKQLEK